MLNARGEETFAYETDASRYANGVEYVWVPEEYTIAPIYDGDQPASWDDCAWKPEKVKA
jgi:hypothetical protein